MSDKTRINEKAHQLISLTTEFCEQHLDDEYEQLCEKLIRKMSRKRNVPYLSGGIEVWAAGVIYALAQINKKDMPFDKSIMINGLIVPIDLLESKSQDEDEDDNTMPDKRQTTLDYFT
jgi:peptide deformylase